MKLQILLISVLTAHLAAQQRPSTCAECPAWNKPQPAFRIYGNTYYVGTRGLSAILIASDTGHILIDGALPESAPHIVANIRSLGFKVEDIKLIVNSHAHFDHAGSLAELQKLSRARVAASPWSANVMKKGVVPPDDPQYGTIAPIARIAKVETFQHGDTLSAASLTITAHLTPGHTPGGTSWTWQSCESGRCLQLVYADSLSAVSATGFQFSRRKQYPHAEDFERSFSFLESTRCDILVTPHPEASNLWQRLDRRNFIDTSACRVLAQGLRERLRKRLAAESGKEP